MPQNDNDAMLVALMRLEVFDGDMVSDVDVPDFDDCSSDDEVKTDKKKAGAAAL